MHLNIPDITKDKALLISTSFVLCTAVSGFMWYNSIAILIFAGTCYLKIDFTIVWKKFSKSGFACTCLLYFLLHFIAGFFTEDKAAGFANVESKLGFLFLPFLFIGILPFNEKLRHSILLILSFFSATVFLYFLFFAFSKYGITGDISVFFYHQLVAPLQHHAVYLASYVSICILYLYFYYINNGKAKPMIFILLVVLIVFMVLLSSKTILVVLLLLFLFEGINNFLLNKQQMSGIIITLIVSTFFLLIVFTNNPMKKRFKEVFTTDLSIVNKKQYTPDMYFNAVQFRLVAWKFSWQLLAESNSYLLGIGPANAQPALNKKYSDANMYVGKSADEPGGYLNFNAHNQFVQSFLQSGILGLLVLVSMLFFFIRTALLQKNKQLLYASILICTFFFSESVLEGQYGIILFLFLPYLLHTTSKKQYTLS